MKHFSCLLELLLSRLIELAHMSFVPSSLTFPCFLFSLPKTLYLFWILLQSTHFLVSFSLARSPCILTKPYRVIVIPRYRSRYATSYPIGLKSRQNLVFKNPYRSSFARRASPIMASHPHPVDPGGPLRLCSSVPRYLFAGIL